MEGGETGSGGVPGGLVLGASWHHAAFSACFEVLLEPGLGAGPTPTPASSGSGEGEAAILGDSGDRLTLSLPLAVGTGWHLGPCGPGPLPALCSPNYSRLGLKRFIFGVGRAVLALRNVSRGVCR